MKNLKILGLLAVAAAAMMAFATPASAIVITEEVGNPLDVGDVVKATSVHFLHTGSVPITCTHSELEGTVTQVGGSPTQDVAGSITKLTWGTGGSCGNNTFTTVVLGELTLESTGKAGEGTLSWYGTEITLLTHNILGTVHCIYKARSTAAGGTHLGTVKDKTLTISSAPIPEVPTDTFACKDDTVWHGDYTFTSPAGWDID